jgi:predicted ATP-grasp superfamily ATP-dependent carboligase
MDFGVSSSYVETIDCPEIEEPSHRLLAAMAFSGLVEVEFKRDLRAGQLKLLDINPRIWGWHSIGRRAGVDFPFLLWQLSQGEDVSTVHGRPGVRWVRAVTDVPTVVAEIRLGRMSLGSYLSSLRGPRESAMLAADDPFPALLEIPLLAQIAWKRKQAANGSRGHQLSLEPN